MRDTADADDYLELRLRRLGIEFDTYHPESDAVKHYNSRLVGRLGPLTIGWGRGYFVVDGPVPIELARWIYAADVEKVIRSGGHCKAPSPDDYGVEWFDVEGKSLVVDPDGKQREAFATSTILRNHDMSQLHFVASLDEVPDRRGVVDSYHIDTDQGLARFVSMARAAGLTK